MAKSTKVESHAVFLNLPYDKAFSSLYLAYIVAVSSLGLVPRATVGLQGPTRLSRMLNLIEACPYSIHDLSRVQIDRVSPATPRFNMPFELGLVVSWSRFNPDHQWFVFEAKLRRIQKSLSDLNGTDVFIHDGTVEGVMREVCNAFVSSTRQPTVPEMLRIYKKLRSVLPQVRRNAASQSLFTARSFSDLSLAAAALARKEIISS
jgi:hypothetical protein